jgi:hypothetical protein
MTGRVAAAAVVITAVGILVDAPRVVAAPVAPRQDMPCPEDLSGALTQLPDQRTILQCQLQGGERRWRGFSSPYPKSDRWLTYGPAVTLHGEGRPNREVDSGEWIAYPQEPEGQCEARQRTVVAAGVLSPVQTSTSKPGQPLTFQMLPLLFTVELRGNCFWQRVQ